MIGTIRKLFYTATLAVVGFSATNFAQASGPDPVTERPGAHKPAAATQPKAEQPKAAQPTVGQPTSPANSPLKWGVFDGSEDLPNHGRLVFVISDTGEVAMADAVTIRTGRTVTGTWREGNGGRVILTFRDCVYEGRIVGNAIIGQARFTSGANAGFFWNFNVSLQPRR